jgi:WD40 repeat protein
VPAALLAATARLATVPEAAPPAVAALADAAVSGVAVGSKLSLVALMLMASLLASGVTLDCRPATAARRVEHVRLASSAADGAEKVSDTVNALEAGTFWRHTSRDFPVPVAFRPDGRLLGSKGANRAEKVWDAATRSDALRGNTGWPPSVAFSPDGRRLAAEGADGTVTVWDMTTGCEVFILRGHTGGVTRLAFSPEESRLATASDYGLMRVWDAATRSDALRNR